jgi:hypothetical protein
VSNKVKTSATYKLHGKQHYLKLAKSFVGNHAPYCNSVFGFGPHL